MVRTKGEAGSGNIVEAVRHIRTVNQGIEEIRELLKKKNTKKLKEKASEYRVPLDLIIQTAKLGRLAVVNFAAGGVATPADAALCMQLGVDGVFVGSGIFKSGDPKKRAKAIVDAVAHFNDADKIAKASENLGEAMSGQEISKLETKLASRGI
jgi:pyridoxal 5'-phosphate synthase pdxS subunit